MLTGLIFRSDGIIGLVISKYIISKRKSLVFNVKTFEKAFDAFIMLGEKEK